MNITLRTTCAASACAFLIPTAFAQSTVTLYGQLDVGVGYISKGTSSLFIPPPVESGKHGVRQVRNTGPSLLGFRGLEDIGGGLQAGFDIQHRLAVDTGAQDTPPGGPFWQGRSLLFLRSATLGEVFVGRDNFLAFYNGAPADPFMFDYSGASLGPDFTSARYTVPGEGGFRVSNQVGWRSPRWAGFAAATAVAAAEGSTGRGRNVSLVGNYVAGPAYFGIGRETSKLLTGGSRAMTNATASWNFGFAKLAVNTARTTDDGATTVAARKISAISFGALAPLGEGNVKFALGRLNPDGADNNTQKVGLGYEYFLSKRTSLKAACAVSKTQGLTRTTAYDAGILHKF